MTVDAAHQCLEFGEFFVELFHDLVEEKFDFVGDLELVGWVEDKVCIFKDVEVKLLCVIKLLDLLGELSGLDVLGSGVDGFEESGQND